MKVKSIKIAAMEFSNGDILIAISENPYFDSRDGKEYYVEIPPDNRIAVYGSKEMKEIYGFAPQKII